MNGACSVPCPKGCVSCFRDHLRRRFAVRKRSQRRLWRSRGGWKSGAVVCEVSTCGRGGAAVGATRGEMRASRRVHEWPRVPSPGRESLPPPGVCRFFGHFGTFAAGLVRCLSRNEVEVSGRVASSMASGPRVDFVSGRRLLAGRSPSMSSSLLPSRPTQLLSKPSQTSSAPGLMWARFQRPILGLHLPGCLCVNGCRALFVAIACGTWDS